MADISVLARVKAGFDRNVDIGSNTLVTTSIKVGGNISNTELTKGLLDRLVLLQNGTDVDATYHTHDTLYFRKTELTDAIGPATGSDLIGDDNTYSNFTPSAATVKGALQGIDTALATAGSTFSDASFRIYDNGDNTKRLAFEVAAVSTATTRTWTVPDTDLSFDPALGGTFANASLSNLSAVAINTDIMGSDSSYNLGGPINRFITTWTINVNSGDQPLLAQSNDTITGASAGVTLKSGATVGGGTDSGSVTIQSGTADGNSGDLAILTGVAGGLRGTIFMLAQAIDIGGTPMTNLVEPSPTLTSDAVNVNFINHRSGIWRRYTVNRTYLNTNAVGLSTFDVPIFTLAGGESVEDVFIKHSIAFSGGGTASATVSVGKTGSVSAYASAFDIFSAASNTSFQRSESDTMENFATTTQAVANVTITGTTFENVTAGAFDVWVKVVNFAPVTASASFV